MRASPPSHDGTTDSATVADARCERGRIGPVGTVARLGVGLTLLGLALFWRDPAWSDAAVGPVLAPALITGALWVRSRFRTAPLRATGPVAHGVNLAIVALLFALPATAGATFLFYGTSMLVAAARRGRGCEVTAISNALLGRDDQVGCPLFEPIDALEARRTPRRAGVRARP
jgi:hypothetical protein